MKLVKLAATYSVFVGIAIIGLWVILYLSNEIPELSTTPIAISMHIAAELVTAILLIVGGVGLLLKRIWGFQIFMFSMGMLFYTLIQSPGYYLEKGERIFVAMFVFFISITLFFVIQTFLKRELFKA